MHFTLIRQNKFMIWTTFKNRFHKSIRSYMNSMLPQKNLVSFLDCFIIESMTWFLVLQWKNSILISLILFLQSDRTSDIKNILRFMWYITVLLYFSLLIQINKLMGFYLYFRRNELQFSNEREDKLKKNKEAIKKYCLKS